jgi:DNA-directed RNA polymerase beta' subunit
MNSIVAQNIQARNECMTISKVSRWFISPQNHAPLVGAFQDGLIGISELTKYGLKFNKWHAMQMFGDIHQAGLNYDFSDKSYTNRQLVSRLLPEINLIGKEPSFYKSQYANFIKYNPEDIKVKIVRGELQSGVIDKAVAGQGVAGSIFHIIANEYGNDAALETVYNLQQIVHRFFGYHGFTVGIADINVSEPALAEIKRRLATMMLNSRKITQRLNNSKLIAPLGMELRDFYENEQLGALSAGDDFANPILADIDVEVNQMFKLIGSGSKGKLNNFVAINGAIGVQTINGRRFGYQAGWGRTSPYFVRYDAEPEANGFISMSFREGVRSDVYAFMAGEARHGLISNALSTSITGYQNRISIKNLESILVDNLRKSAKGMNVIQPLYAECGLDPSKMEKVKFPSIDISQEKFDADYKTKLDAVDKKYRNAETQEALDAEYKQLAVDREKYRSIHLGLESHNPKEYVMNTSKQMPVNVARIIDDVVYNYTDMTDKLGDKTLDPVLTVNLVKDLCDGLGYVFLNELQRKLKRKIPKHIIASTTLIQILIRSYLCTSYLIRKGVTANLLDIIVQRILLMYKKALIDYGTSVGILAAQCVCELMTQYVLDSKHRTGGQGGTQTNAIVRIQEILGAKSTESMKNPHMLIMVKPEYENDKLKVQEIANHIEMMSFGRFVSNTRIFFETYGKPTHPDYKREASDITLFEKHNAGMKVPGDLAKWCVRFGLNKEEMILKSMKLETIVLAIRKAHPELYLVYTPENSDNLYIRCYLRNTMFKQTLDYYTDSVLFIMNEVKKVIVRGVKDIVGTAVIDVMKNEVGADGSLSMKKVSAIYASGSNMADVLSNPYIDPYRTQSDSIEEMQRVFGVTAARNKIINEMMSALDGLNRIHCSVFADEMCYAGQVSNIQKTGLQKRENANVTLRLSFQTAIQVIQDAAIHGLVDHISGISGPLVMGTNPNIGTTYNQIVVNRQFIEENAKTLETIAEDL